MIHANGSATRGTRSHTNTYAHTRTTCIGRRSSECKFADAGACCACTRICTYTRACTCASLWLSATQISLCVPPRLKSLDLPFSLARKALVTKASVHPFNGFLELEVNQQRRRREQDDKPDANGSLLLSLRRFVSCLRAVTQSRKYIVIFDAAPGVIIHGPNYGTTELLELPSCRVALAFTRPLARPSARSFARARARAPVWADTVVCREIELWFASN